MKKVGRGEGKPGNEVTVMFWMYATGKRDVRYEGCNLITGLDCGLDHWTGLMDWITGLKLYVPHVLHQIRKLRAKTTFA